MRFTLAPQASKTAFAMAPPTQIIAGSPPPCGLEFILSIKTQVIFGVLENEAEHGIISYKAPISKALLGKKQGDEVKVKLPKSIQEYEIISITYIPIMELKQEAFREFDIQ